MDGAKLILHVPTQNKKNETSVHPMIDPILCHKISSVSRLHGTSSALILLTMPESYESSFFKALAPLKVDSGF